MNEDVSLIPPYLLDTDGAQPEEGGAHRTYGTLSYNRRRDCWVVRGDPGVTELCKRLFPGSESGRRGEARFPAHRRIVGDLNWLMLRYPLAVRAADRERWEQALAMLAQTGAYPALVVAPPHLLRNWENEIARFVRRPDGSPLSVHVIRGLKPYALPPADIYLMHYLLLRGWKEALPECAIPTVIFDEIQELRHGGTEKYSAASLLAGAASRVAGLSGTPIYNRGAEIWNVVNILDFHFLGDYESFTREWCYGYGNQIVAKPELLGEKLREEGLMLRRTKRDVLRELPPKRRLVMPVDSDDAVYRRLMQPVRETLARLKSDAEADASQRALWKMAVESGERQATGMAKAPYVAQFVRALLDADERVLLFAHHHQVMDLYKKELKAYSPAFITGRETPAMKERSVERFMAGRTNLCCVSLRAAAGLNLQRASCVVFGELDWSPAVHSQAEDRAHRMGQTDSILCYYLVSQGGSDQDMQDALGLKVSQFVGLMGDRPPAPEDELLAAQAARQHIEQLVARLLREAG